MRLILIILGIYVAVRLLGRLLSPLMNKSGSSTARGPNRQEADNRKEGEVKIEYTDKKKRKNNSDSGEGDYVDFEELD